MSTQSIARAEQPAFAQPDVAQVALLTTFRRSGQAVSTPVGTMTGDGKVYFMTPAKTGKAKRIRNNPQVTLAPCTFKGERLGPTVEGVARRLNGSEAQRAPANLRWRSWVGLGHRLSAVVSWR
ncbi:MAG: PPOX class F420-dependent oxidoreductase [Chloroflexi bacterium]|nr:PPOX class F420-dependent oxidoreductase [Chloroflexota bacterium]MCI0576178.1 PPOX class F420-dependent oxidoreductase [Chloroflexota bacterium]MCI0648969.1 PPOX class F420-dependent oxidoreductase [Chloroflexota bacterium]MCI0728185.1 PPOX class F420-dependent oxidoreductase [Chloroflexota bacterium]